MMKHNYIAVLQERLSRFNGDIEVTVKDDCLILDGVTQKVHSMLQLQFRAPHYMDDVGRTVVPFEDPLARILTSNEHALLDELIDGLSLPLLLVNFGIREYDPKMGYIKFVSEEDIFAMEFRMIENAIDHEDTLMV
jgi:hypothetical protein